MRTIYTSTQQMHEWDAILESMDEKIKFKYFRKIHYLFLCRARVTDRSSKDGWYSRAVSDLRDFQQLLGQQNEGWAYYNVYYRFVHEGKAKIGQIASFQSPHNVAFFPLVSFSDTQINLNTAKKRCAPNTSEMSLAQMYYVRDVLLKRQKIEYLDNEKFSLMKGRYLERFSDK